MENTVEVNPTDNVWNEASFALFHNLLFVRTVYMCKVLWRFLPVFFCTACVLKMLRNGLVPALPPLRWLLFEAFIAKWDQVVSPFVS